MCPVRNYVIFVFTIELNIQCPVTNITSLLRLMPNYSYSVLLESGLWKNKKFLIEFLSLYIQMHVYEFITLFQTFRIITRKSSFWTEKKYIHTRFSSGFFNRCLQLVLSSVSFHHCRIHVKLMPHHFFYAWPKDGNCYVVVVVRLFFIFIFSFIFVLVSETQSC